MPLFDSIVLGAWAFACVLGGALAGASGAYAQGPALPQRVVSINLCTDQLALLIAAPGQLVSVSQLAHDPDSSAMAAQAAQVPANGARAEEVFLLAPDLVLAGTFTAPATVNMLRDLGIEVIQFAPANSLSDVPDRLEQMGIALGRETAAADLKQQFERDLSALSDARNANRFRAAITYVNSYSSGDATLAGDILKVAGFDNVAVEAGLASVGRLGLEDLVMLAPDVIIQGRDYPGHARAEDNLNHLALRALPDTLIAGEITDRDWVCGTPHVLNAVAAMRDLRRLLEAEK